MPQSKENNAYYGRTEEPTRYYFDPETGQRVPFKSPNRIDGTKEDDVLVGTDPVAKIYRSDGKEHDIGGDDIIFGKEGDDTINGLDGDDVLGGNEGNDLISGGDGDDLIVGHTGNDQLFGDDGDDRIGGGAGDDLVDGGDGHDQISGDDGNDYVTGGNGNDDIDGGEGNDFLLGESGADFISGGDGDDYILGGSGDDNLLGGNGDDFLGGGQGRDVIDGGDGIDTVSYDDDRGIGRVIDLGRKASFIFDSLDGALVKEDSLFNIENVIGSDFSDEIIGDDNNNEISAGNGNDLIDAGKGNDISEGGLGRDTFIFRHERGDGSDELDIITDFDPFEDRLDLRLSEVGSLEQLMRQAHESEAGVVMQTSGEDWIFIENVRIADFTEDNVWI